MVEKLAGAAAQGFALFPGGSKLEYISKPLPAEETAHTRFNDGACDSKGRFFAGTLYSPNHGIPGRLYRYDPVDKTCTVADPGPFTVSARKCSVSLLLTKFRIPMASDGAQTRRRCKL